MHNPSWQFALTSGEVRVWRVRLDELRPERLPQPTPGEEARAARLQKQTARDRYLRSHQVLRAILGQLTAARLDFAVTERGKPYVPGAPELRFSLSRSHGMALVAVAPGIDVGVDVERLRPLPEYDAIAQRFFPPSEAAALGDCPPAERERDFFRRWTRIEAMLKARGVGLYGAGAEIGGEWSAWELDAGEEFAGAAAAEKAEMRIRIEDFSV